VETILVEDWPMMNDPSEVYLCSGDRLNSNARGDLFTRLAVDFLYTLGYEVTRTKIHKPGREVDLVAWHRAENRGALAECKATGKIGGDSINKFIGVLDSERRKTARELGGYFISLGGFTVTALEQESDLGSPRLVLVDSKRLTRELIAGRIICPPEEALVMAGRCSTNRPAINPKAWSVQLIAHEVGWLWACFFSNGGKRTHFCLIHADGQTARCGTVREGYCGRRQFSRVFSRATLFSATYRRGSFAVT
jgi:hypothetical protein